MGIGEGFSDGILVGSLEGKRVGITLGPVGLVVGFMLGLVVFEVGLLVVLASSKVSPIDTSSVIRK